MIKPLKKGAIDLTGMKFGYLTVLGPGDIIYSGHDKAGRPLSRRRWRVHCALCNREVMIIGSTLKNNERVESCGDCGRKRAGEIMRESAIRDEGELLTDLAKSLGIQYQTLYQRYQNGDRGPRLRRPVA
jgi:hypothetical protein